MATALKIPEPSYRLGSGRYIQKSGAILDLAKELEKLGIAPTQENLTLFYEKIISSSAMAGTTNEEKAKLFEALKIVQ